MFQAPTLDSREQQILAQISEQSAALGALASESEPWSSTLSRSHFAHAIQGTLRLEGAELSLAEIEAALAGEGSPSRISPHEPALAGALQAEAFTGRLVLSGTKLNPSYLRSLHFMLRSHSAESAPGLHRSTGDSPLPGRQGEIRHVGVTPQGILAATQVFTLTLHDGADHLIGAIMAHLNLALLRPFERGNRQLARLVHSTLIRGGANGAAVIPPIDEFLGAHSEEYDAVLREVGQGDWNAADFRPMRARPWVRYMLAAHLSQVTTQISRLQHLAALSRSATTLVTQAGLPARALQAIYAVHLSGSLTRARYLSAVAGAAEYLTEQTASRDLAALVQAGLLRAKGDKRGRSYLPGIQLERAMPAPPNSSVLSSAELFGEV